MKILADQLKTNLIVNFKFYLRYKVITFIGIFFIFLLAIALIPTFLILNPMEKLKNITFLFSEMNVFFKILVGIISLIAIYYHINLKCLKVIFTKPFSPELWILSHFLSIYFVSFILYSFLFLVCSILATIWALPIHTVLLLLVLVEFSKSLIVISGCSFLSALTHPILSGFLLLGINIFNGLIITVDTAMKYTKNILLSHFLKGIKYCFEFIYFLIPSFNPYSQELAKVFYSFKFNSQEYQYIALILLYSIVINCLFYFLSLYVFRKKKYLYI